MLVEKLSEIKNGNKVSYEEFQEIQKNFDERIEYLNGKIYFKGASSDEQEEVIVNLHRKLFNYFSDKNCIPYGSNKAVFFKDENNEEHYILPDLKVICDSENHKDGKYKGVPLLVIEVLSQGNKDNDLKVKKVLYEKMGVKEYMIFVPLNSSVMVYNFKDNKSNIISLYVGDEKIVKSNIFENLEFDLNEIFSYSW